MWLRVARLLSAIALMVLAHASVRAANSIQQTDIRPQGYGMHATGGATQCHFADEASLRNCLGRGGALAIADVAFSVDPGRNRFMVAADTTLDGKGLLTITPSLYGIEIRESNVIIRNVLFHGTGRRASILSQLYPNANCSTPVLAEQVFGCMVGIHLLARAKNIWIDHNTFSDCGDICISVWDNNDGTGHPDAITISNNIFRNSFFAIGVGVAGTAITLPPPGHLTFYGNLFSAIFRRQPRVSDGYQGHVFNNYYTGPPCHGVGPGLGRGLGFGPSVEANGEILFENNVADPQSCGSHIDNSDFVPLPGTGIPRGHGKIDARRNSGFISDTDSGRNKIPGIRKDKDQLGFNASYPYHLLAPNFVKTFVLTNAGVDSKND